MYANHYVRLQTCSFAFRNRKVLKSQSGMFKSRTAPSWNHWEDENFFSFFFLFFDLLCWKTMLKSFFSNNLQIPEQWRRFFYDWEPQIWYFLQQFAWVRRSEEYTKQVAIKFALTSTMTADLRVKTPDAVAERTDLALPLTIERFPTSLQEIKNSLYGKTIACIKFFQNSVINVKTSTRNIWKILSLNCEKTMEIWLIFAVIHKT